MVMTGKEPGAASAKAATLALLLAALSIIGLHAPALAQSDEERVGRQAAAQLVGAAPLWQNPRAQQYVNLVGRSVAEPAGAAYTWRFGVLASDSVNAFATPGGYVFVTRGLLRLLQSEDELAFVLGHEISHVLQRHHYQVIQRQRLAAQAAGQLQAATGDAELGKLSLASGQIYARGLDKGAEHEADRLGLEWMARAGYDPAAALGVLDKLHALKGDDPRAMLLFATHPSAAERLDELLRAGAEQMPRPAVGAMARERRFGELRQLL
jgi:predicted Zn-dependent protease